MFTGIVEELGAIISIEKSLAGTRMTILASTVMGDLKIGDSVSVNGTCLTVVSKSEHNFSVEVSPETLSVTTLGLLMVGSLLNLERAMKLNERLGGHLVSYHVDGVGTVRVRQQEANAILLTIEASPDVLHHCIVKGSVTVDGISLTINQMTDRGFSVAIIPHTYQGHQPGAQASGRSGQSRIGSDWKIRRTVATRKGAALTKLTPVIDKKFLQKRGLL